MTVCTEGSPDTFDISQSDQGVTHDAAGRMVFDQLVMLKRGTTELAPGLAERWEVSADGLSYTLHLRQGVKFHRTAWFKPSREMDADDVVFSIRRMADPKGPWRVAATRGFMVWATVLADQVKSIEKLDDMTVRFALLRPNAAFLSSLALSFIGSVHSAEYGELLLKIGKPELINVQPIGTGPFVFRSYQKDSVIRYDANPDYWGGAPKIDRLVLAITPDPIVRVQRLKAGECLLGTNMGAENANALDGTRVRMIGSTPLKINYIVLNTRKKYLSDRSFRLALALAFDKASYGRALYSGRATPASSFLPPAQWGHDTELKTQHDPQQASQLVQASGYDGSELVIFGAVGGSFAKRAGEMMQADWARIGVKSRVQMMEFGELLARAGRGEHDITFFSLGGGGDPNDFFGPDLTCAGVAAGMSDSFWCDKAFDALLETARATDDRSQRTALYKKAQRWVFDEVPVIPTVYSQVFTAVHDTVHGFIVSPINDLDFRNVSVD